MKSTDLKEAQNIVNSLAYIDTALSYSLCPKSNRLSVRVDEKGSETYLDISKKVAEAALEMQKTELRMRRDALLRRAAQIGLVLA